MKEKLYKYVIPPVLFAVIYLVGKTLRVQFINRDVENQLEKKGQTRIYTLWHGRLFYFPFLYSFSKKYNILISPSGDGEVVARTLKLFGFLTIRGSSYKKAGAAMLKLVRTIKKGNSVGVVGDGSRGPRFKAKKGIINLAYLTGVPILPVVYGAKNKIELNSWDRFVIPFPFSKIKVMYGKPVYVDKKGGEKYLQGKLEELETELKNITLKVDSWN